MSEPALVADTSILIHFMEGNLEAGQWLLNREVHISVVLHPNVKSEARPRK